MLAYAKLNLCLEVVGLRSDGFHDIHSLVQTIDLADHIEISWGTDIQVSCSTKLDGPNIVEQAVRRLLNEKRSRSGIHIKIEKNIPMGAGLGGGSSDAATVLAVVNRLVPPVLPSSELSRLADTIGADVPLFLTGGCVRVSGRGNPEAFLAPRLETYVVLVPPVHCATSRIYRAWHVPVAPTSGSRPGDWLELGRNDLFQAAASLIPELQGFQDAVAGLGGRFFGMTGSGSGFYAAFDDRVHANQAWLDLTRQQPGCRVYYCRSTATGFTQLRGG